VYPTMSGTSSIGKPSLEGVLQVARAWFGREITVTAPSKLNLRLKVEGRRGDGYHLLSMLNCSTSLEDTLRLTLSEASDIIVNVNPSGALGVSGGENLASKAFKAFWSAFGFDSAPVGFRCEIQKRIPIGGGLGGGSSDAGAVLRYLEGIFGESLASGCNLSKGQVRERVLSAALSCGADVPYAVVGGLCWVGGIGEEVVPIQEHAFGPHKALLVIPPKPVPTADFYQRFRASHPTITPWQDRAGRDLTADKGGEGLVSLVENDFEATAVEMVPEIGSGLRLMREVFPVGTALTGSGSVCFSLVPNGMEGRASELSNRLGAQGFTSRLCQLIF